jgi:hypothetical protein
MELGHDHFGGGNTFGFVNVDGNAAAIVGHGAGAIGIERDGDAVRVPCECFIDGVVHHLIDHVMQA